MRFLSLGWQPARTWHTGALLLGIAFVAGCNSAGSDSTSPTEAPPPRPAAESPAVEDADPVQPETAANGEAAAPMEPSAEAVSASGDAAAPQGALQVATEDEQTQPTSPVADTAGSPVTAPAESASASEAETANARRLPPRDAQGRLMRPMPSAPEEPLRGPRVVRPTRPGATLAPGETQEITFDTIKFEMEVGEPFERSMLTPEIESLMGTKVRIRGYMLPSFQQRDIKQFVLVRDNMECCFGPGAALYDCVIVDMKGAGATYTVRPVAVEGVLTVDEVFGISGEHLAIYHIDGEEVR